MIPGKHAEYWGVRAQHNTIPCTMHVPRFTRIHISNPAAWRHTPCDLNGIVDSLTHHVMVCILRVSASSRGAAPRTIIPDAGGNVRAQGQFISISIHTVPLTASIASRLLILSALPPTQPRCMMPGAPRPHPHLTLDNDTQISNTFHAGEFPKLCSVITRKPHWPLLCTCHFQE